MSNTVITWKDIKLAALQKMFSANGTTIQFDSSNSEYLYAMPNTANEGLQMLATAGKFLLGEYTIVNRPINPLNGSFENVQITEGEYRFSIDGAKSYYFRCEGVCTVNIVVGDTTFKTIDVQSKEKYATYKGNIDNPDGKNVSLVFIADYPCNIKNIALYGVRYETDEDVDDYEEYLKFNMDELVENFYQLAENQIYFEGDEEPKYLAATDYYQEADKTLVIPRSKVGAYTVYYKKYPKQITSTTPDDYVLQIDPEVAVLLTIYMASVLYMDDDLSIATSYRNYFEVGLNRLSQRANVSKKEEFISESGWC